MPEYLTPGVYVEEIDSGSKPIEGVGTNTCAFIGYAKSGDFNKPTFISSWSQFVDIFGHEENDLIAAMSQSLGIKPEQVVSLKNAANKGWADFAFKTMGLAIKQEEAKGRDGKTLKTYREFLKSYDLPEAASPYIEGSYLAHSVFGFYNNGGSRAYIVRVPYKVEGTAAAGTNGTGSVAGGSGGEKRIEAARAAIGPMTFVAKEAGPEGNKVAVDFEPVDGDEFRIRISKGSAAPEIFPAKDGKMKVAQAVEVLKASKLVMIEIKEAPLEMKPIKITLEGGMELTAPSAASVPAKLNGLGELARYAAPLISDLSAGDFIGDEASRTGVGGLSTIEDINMVAIPDLMAGAFHHETFKIGGMEQEGDEVCVLTDARRQAILDAQVNLVGFCENMGDRCAILDPLPGLNAQQMRDLTLDTPYGADKGHAAIYYPWIKIADPKRKGKQLFVPPSGHVAGIWARVVGERGVHKAPANEVMRGVVALETELTRGDQAILNPEGINAIRMFPGEGIKVYGARTLATRGNPSWKYVNVRRLFDYIEKSIEKSITWAVFEPNDPDLWGRLRRNISAFLFTEWKEGKLMGTVPSEAYYVKCDADTNPQEMIDLGRVYVEVGVNPVKPAEFVIIRIGQWNGGGSTSEQ